MQCNLKENTSFQELTFLEMLEKDSWALQDNYSTSTGEVAYHGERRDVSVLDSHLASLSSLMALG